jgi:hypothetical protein
LPDLDLFAPALALVLVRFVDISEATFLRRLASFLFGRLSRRVP